MKNTLDTKVDKLIKIVTQNTDTVDGLSNRVDNLSKTVGNISTTVDTLSKKVDRLSKTVNTLSKNVDDLTEATAKGFADTVSKKDFESLEKKFDVLGKEVNNSLGNHITDVRKDYDSLTSRVKRLETRGV